MCLILALNDNVLPDGRFKLQLDDVHSFASDESCIAWEKDVDMHLQKLVYNTMSRALIRSWFQFLSTPIKIANICYLT